MSAYKIQTLGNYPEESLKKLPTPAPGLHVGRCSPTCPVTQPTPTLSPSFLLAQAIFEPSLFSPVNARTFLKHSHSAPICLWRWNRQCSEMSAYKIQTLGITQKKAYNNLLTG